MLVANGGYTSRAFEVYRLTADGALDATFGVAGKVSLPGRAYGITISGKALVAVGIDDPDEGRRIRIARIWL